jgi:hypothetical protein
VYQVGIAYYENTVIIIIIIIIIIEVKKSHYRPEQARRVPGV